MAFNKHQKETCTKKNYNHIYSPVENGDIASLR